MPARGFQLLGEDGNPFHPFFQETIKKAIPHASGMAFFVSKDQQKPYSDS